MSGKPAGGQGRQPATNQTTTGESCDAGTLTVAVGEVTTLDHKVGDDACSSRGPQGRCQLWATASAAHESVCTRPRRGRRDRACNQAAGMCLNQRRSLYWGHSRWKPEGTKPKPFSPVHSARCARGRGRCTATCRLAVRQGHTQAADAAAGSQRSPRQHSTCSSGGQQGSRQQARCRCTGSRCSGVHCATARVPPHQLTKFSTVFGTTSPNRPNTTRPAGSPPISMSK